MQFGGDLGSHRHLLVADLLLVQLEAVPLEHALCGELARANAAGGGEQDGQARDAGAVFRAGISEDGHG